MREYGNGFVIKCFGVCCRVLVRVLKLRGYVWLGWIWGIVGVEEVSRFVILGM